MISTSSTTTAARSAAGDFTIASPAATPPPPASPAQGPPAARSRLDPGNYSVGIIPRRLRHHRFSPDCRGTIAAGETKTCTITINDLPRRGTLLVVGEVVNDDGGTLGRATSRSA